ncbi:hypothetical protein B3286c2_0562 [Brucella vulpis]|uniref:RNA-directed DNA polymerase n=1 Tax=Brucella vulpis TaxID=981386 RepID=UPI00073A7852|nr:hypothetical protein BF3285c2_0567 [Brucella vulpis]CUW51579.1 hypothetical protein B3286c2_0562 [Brucella vulpis]
MPIFKETYQDLLPKGKNLCDVTVLAQARKKSHTYIRRHNWYADVLELDASTIDLEKKLKYLADEVRQPDFQPINLRLVSAPKNARWGFHTTLPHEPAFDDWAPSVSAQGNDSSAQLEQEQPRLKLRPLAHLSIRDQTLSTAVMMCLAEAVESAQGDTSGTDVAAMRSSGVVSYGNRLHCTWATTQGVRPRAHFSWGNSRTYRQYFQDYRAFLARPPRVCAEVTPQLRPGRELFVVSLDIKSFFDRVDRDALLNELKVLTQEHQTEHGLSDTEAADGQFWKRAAQIFSWKWHADDQQEAALIRGEEHHDHDHDLELGLPQGLVASGFLSNAYLVGFDRDMQQSLTDRDIGCDGIKLLDYCRYVDDMRLVVETKSGATGISQATLLGHVTSYVTSVLKAHCERMGARTSLELSPEKCVATSYLAISAQSHVSALMEMLNAELSGTFDLASLAQVAGGLDGLLWGSEQIETAAGSTTSRLALATVSVPNTDVRDDTVKRFVATRITQLMRHRLAMTDLESPAGSAETISDHVTQGVVLSHEFETTARKLIKCWAENPALVLSLRCGLDLFPHPRLLNSLVEALNIKLFNVPADLDAFRRRQVRVAEYVLADLLRVGAVETGFRNPEEYPEGVDIQGYREDLGDIARRVLTERTSSPWYLRQQAHLYLASIGDASAAMKRDVAPEMQAYTALQRAAKFEPMQDRELKDAIPLAIVAQQLQPNARRFGVWLSEGLMRTDDEGIQEAIVQSVALSHPELLMAALNRRQAANWRKFVPAALIQDSKRPTNSRGHPAKLRNILSLLQIINEPNNLFDQENALLMLADALLRHPGIEEQLSSGISAANITIKSKNWSRLAEMPNETGFLSVDSIDIDKVTNPRYETPEWVAPEKAWLYGLGRILRSALTGEFDFTSRRYLFTEEVGRYSGLRSTWFKRRFGLLNSGRGLLDEPGPVSPWLSSFLSTLLQWPGVEFRANSVSAAGDVRNAAELLALVQNRISIQHELFGPRSKTPMYVVPVDDHESLQDRPLRVAIVQPMRPQLKEFDEKDLTHWTPGILAEHHRHLAEVCKLTHQKLKTWASASPKIASETNDASVVDVYYSQNWLCIRSTFFYLGGFQTRSEPTSLLA